MTAPSPQISRTSSRPPDGPLAALVERLVDDMGRRWRKGDRAQTEAYLAAHPELVEHPEAALELLYEEVCLSREHGRPLAETDVARRFPQWRKNLKILFGFHQLIETGPAPPAFPAPGEMLGDFRLATELGRGAQGRVFLATQPGLADRAVVLKLTPCRGQEHLSLARLQHTHIVPLYSAHHFLERNLRALCMPYFGGTTLAYVLEQLASSPPAQRRGQQIVEVLRQAQAAAPLPVAVEGPVCQFLAGASYVQAICWLGGCLADALQYAREHGLVHLDLKPSNVLLAADGLPMLLDFHLARAPLATGAPAPEWLGGTPAYMAPEHRQALEAVRAGADLPAAVDERADVYALGVLLHEALGGPMPLAGEAPGVVLRRQNPQVSVGLADILTRCLADDAARRYPDAAALAADLRLHLADRPLRGVANRSWAERWRKRRRRRPYAIAILGLVLAVAGAGAFVGNHFRGVIQQGESFLQEGANHLREHHPAQALNSLRHGLDALTVLPFESDVTHALRLQMRRASEALAQQGFHDFMERIRGIYGESLPAGKGATEIESYCRRFWEQREQIGRRLDAELLEAGEEGRQDLLDLAVFWTDLRVRLAGKAAAAAHREALTVLEQAELLCGPSGVLYRERAAHAAALGLTEEAREATARAGALRPHTAWEHYAVGRAFLREGDLPRAAAEFDRALALQPQALWPNFSRGKCAYQQGQYVEALASFNACVALEPTAWCLANRGLAYAALGRTERALLDFDQALHQEPSFALAAFNRGLLHLRAKRYALAQADLQRALDLGANAAEVYHHLALLELAQGHREAARADVARALEYDPNHRAARDLAERLADQP